MCLVWIARSWQQMVPQLASVWRGQGPPLGSQLQQTHCRTQLSLSANMVAPLGKHIQEKAKHCTAVRRKNSVRNSPMDIKVRKGGEGAPGTEAEIPWKPVRGPGWGRYAYCSLWRTLHWSKWIFPERSWDTWRTCAETGSWHLLQPIERIPHRSSFSGKNCGPWRIYAGTAFSWRPVACEEGPYLSREKV